MKGNFGPKISQVIPPRIGPMMFPKNMKKSLVPKIFPLCFFEILLKTFWNNNPAEIEIVRSNKRIMEKLMISLTLINNQVTRAPKMLVIVMAIFGWILSMMEPNLGAKRVANIPAGKYA